jgi:N6-adenosine-specific RNA methylase IME4
VTWEGLTPPYATIVADPPWDHSDGWPAFSNNPTDVQRGNHRLAYSAMTVEEIAALPVVDLAAPGAHLYLWTTNRYLDDAFDVLRAWGFDYSLTLVWCKEPKGLAPGGPFAITTEFIVYGRARPRLGHGPGDLIRKAREAAGLSRGDLHVHVRGTKPTGIVYRWEENACLPTERDWQQLQAVLPALRAVPRPDNPIQGRLESTWWQWKRGAPSQKPAALLDAVEQVSPGPYVELFARQPRLGWDSWGWGYEDPAHLFAPRTFQEMRGAAP